MSREPNPTTFWLTNTEVTTKSSQLDSAEKREGRILLPKSLGNAVITLLRKGDKEIKNDYCGRTPVVVKKAIDFQTERDECKHVKCQVTVFHHMNQGPKHTHLPLVENLTKKCF